MNRVLITLAVVAVILAGELIFPIQVSAAPPANPPVPNEFWMAAANWVRVYANEGCTALLTVLRNDPEAGSYVQILLNDPSGAVLVDYYIIDRSNGATITQGSGWLPLAAFGSSLQWMGTVVPLNLIVQAGQRTVTPYADCQRWLECNGESPMPRWAQSGWGWIDRVGNRSGILTTHEDDCEPYRRMQRPPGCYP